MYSERRKALGQNFLINDRAARTIVHRFNAHKEDLIIEIGPGGGALTKHLAESGAGLYAIEKDLSLCDRLKGRFQHFQNVRIINSDILKHDLRHFCERTGSKEKKMRIIGNLPYSISKPVLMKIVSERSEIKDFMLMLQREVADKLLSGPGTKVYSPLSVLFLLTTELRKIMELTPRSFSPAPNVHSTVIHGHVLERSLFKSDEEEMTTRVVKALFLQRRKTIKNNLALFLKNENTALEVLEGCKLKPETRAEMLSPGDFVRIASFINMKGKAILL